MLNKDDLQAIQGVLETTIDKKLQPLIRDFDTLKKEIKPIKSMQKDIKSIKKNIDVMIDLFDNQDVKLGKRIEKLEIHAGIAT